MTHLVGIDKGPVLDWTNDIGLAERYRKWKKWVEVLFKGPLNTVAEGVKCNYVIYWSGDHGMELVDKWTAEGKITDANKDTLDTYWTHFLHCTPGLTVFLYYTSGLTVFSCTVPQD